MAKAKRGRPKTGKAREGVIPIRFSEEEREALEWLAEGEALSTFIRRHVVGHAVEARRQCAYHDTMALGYEQQGKQALAAEERDRSKRLKITMRTTPGMPSPIEAWEPFTGVWPDHQPEPPAINNAKLIAAEVAKILKGGQK